MTINREAAGEDFYNPFALAAPDGSIAGKVRKAPPANNHKVLDQ
jgi:hypothetical protein